MVRWSCDGDGYTPARFPATRHDDRILTLAAAGGFDTLSIPAMLPFACVAFCLHISHTGPVLLTMRSRHTLLITSVAVPYGAYTRRKHDPIRTSEAAVSIAWLTTGFAEATSGLWK